MKYLKETIAVLTIIGICFGAYFYIDEKYAKASDVRKIEQRLDYKITYDQLMAIQERIWRLEDKYGKEPEDETIREELRELRQEKEHLELKLQSLQE